MKKKTENAKKYKRAMTLHHIGELADAKVEYLKILQREPDNLIVLKSLGLLNAQTGNYEEALKYYEKYRLLAPGFTDIYGNLGYCLYSSGELDEAADVLNKAVSIDPRDEQAWNNYGLVKQGKKDLIGALQCFEKSVELAPKNSIYLYNLATLLLNQKKIELARDGFEKVLRIDPTHPQACNNLAKCLLESGQPAEGLALGKIALTNDRTLLEAYDTCAQASRQLGLLDQAIEFYDEALVSCKDHYPTLINKANLLWDINRYDDAISVYNQAIKASVTPYEALNNMGLILANIKEKKEEALACFSRAISLFPQQYSAYMHRANTYMDLGKYDSAISDYSMATNFESESADLWYNYGRAYDELKKYKAALDCYERAASIENHKRSEYNSAILLLKSGEYDAGFGKYGSRFEAGINLVPPSLPNIMHYDGSCKSRNLFLWAEQGVGDEVFFMNFARHLTNYFDELVVSADARLLAVLRRSMPNIRFIKREESYVNVNLGVNFSHAPLGDAPGILNKLSSIRDLHFLPYLTPDFDKSSKLRDRLTYDHGELVGLSWRSSNLRFGDEKSLDVSELRSILESKDLTFIPLQYGNVSSDIRRIRALHPSVRVLELEDIDFYNDIDGLISVISLCDYVVTVSNLTAHLAGALGIKAFVLTPFSRGKFWYWGENASSTPWYPSLRILSQKEPGIWSSLMTELQSNINRH